MNQTPLFMREYLNSSNSSTSAESDEFFKHYHYLCKICRTVPIINFSSIGKIEFFCKCNKYPRRLNIRNIYDLLYYSEEIDYDNKLLKCQQHGDDFEKYIAYCQKCKTNLCNKCCIGCIKHQNKVIVFSYDEETLKKSEYIKKIISEKNIVNEQEINTNQINFNIININEEGNEEQYFLGNNIDNDNNDNENEKFNYINNEKKLGIYNFINLFKIIIKDYQDYPNFNHIETIYNLEKFVNYYLSDYNEINLNYEFNEENIKDDSIELFGKEFFFNNKENCFLIINEKIMDLNHTIKLNDIFYIIPNNYPIKLDVRLIERKRKVMTNWTSMFNSISTITSKSNFDGYDSSNITSFRKMFYNCEFIENIPDISKLNTKSLSDISFMFFNCSSLKALPDISKWNTENVIFSNKMFENCSSLTSLPGISNWNINKIKYMNYMFKNCSSIPNLKELLNWNISAQTITTDMFQGTMMISERENNIIENENNRKEINFKNIVKKICWCFYNDNEFNKYLFFFIFIPLFCIIFISFFPLRNSFDLDVLKEYVHKPLKYINTTNDTNIRYIASFHKITNLTKIKENEKEYINNLLNFTNINENITFEFYQERNKLYNIIIFFIFMINTIFFDYILYTFEKTKNNTIYIILILIFLAMEIVKISLLIKDINLIIKLKRALDSFHLRVRNIYKIKSIKTIIITKINNFYFFQFFLYILEFITILFVLLGLKLCYEILKIRQSIFIKRNPLINSNND